MGDNIAENKINSAIKSGYIRKDIFHPASSWLRPSDEEVRFIIQLTTLTDYELSNLLDVNDRTVRKWKSGETNMVFTTWYCLSCLLDIKIINLYA